MCAPCTQVDLETLEINLLTRVIFCNVLVYQFPKQGNGSAKINYRKTNAILDHVCPAFK